MAKNEILSSYYFQMSMTSNQSSVLSQKPSIVSSVSTAGVSTHPGYSGVQQPVMVQQQMLSQQEILNQQMLQMQQLQMANQQRLYQSQPVLPQVAQQNGQRPMSQQIPVVQQVNAQQNRPAQQIVQQVMAQQNRPAQPIPVVQQVAAQQNRQSQQIMTQQTSQQNGIQYVHLSNGMLMPVMSVAPQQPSAQQPSAQQNTQQNYIMPQHEAKSVSSSPNKHTYSSIKEAKTEISDSKNAQRAQLAMSQDAGLKCSQI